MLLLMVGGIMGGEAGIVIALFFAIAMNFGAYWFSDRIALGMTKAHPVSEEDDADLYRLVAEQAFLAGLPMPKVYEIESNSPNAFATGRNPKNATVAVTTGIRQLLSRDELGAVMAHEMAHVDQKHIVRKLKLQSTDRSVTSGIAQVLGGATLSAKIALERLNDLAFKMLMEEGLSKEDEADADQKALEMLMSLGYDPQSYLDYLQSLKPYLEQGQAKVLSKTHPTIIFRYNNLREFIMKNDLENFKGKKNEKRFQKKIATL